jgi:Tetratricopeptide repeat
MNTLVGLYLFQGQYKKSEALLREALKAFERSTTPDSYVRFNCQSLLGAGLAAQKKYEEAEPLLLSAYEGMLHGGSLDPCWRPVHDRASRKMDRSALRRLAEAGESCRVAEQAKTDNGSRSHAIVLFAS